MNKKGFASIFLLLLSLNLLAIQLETKNIAAKKRTEFVTGALEAEKTFFRRAQIEKNFDFIIEKTMYLELAKKNFEAESIKQKVIEKIVKLAELSEENSPTMHAEFFIEENSARKKPEKTSLENAVQVIVISNGKLVYAEFVYTGGTKRNILFKAEIRAGNFSSEFMIPKGYTIRTGTVTT